MKAVFEKSRAEGAIWAPPSKSYSHRLLIGGALSNKSVISNIMLSEDIKDTLTMLSGMGSEVGIQGNEVCIGGLDPFNLKNNLFLKCNESASTLRFLIPLLSLSENNITIECSNTLINRPLSVYSDLYKEKGLIFEISKNKISVKGPLKSGEYILPGNVSSQFISGLLFALPLLPEDSKIEITEEIQSASYIDMTIDVLRRFGVEALISNNCYFIKGNQKYNCLNEKIEGDYSNAAFLDAFNVFCGKVSINGLLKESLQADSNYLEYYKLLEEGTPKIDIKNCIDLAPILFVISSLKNGATFINTKRLADKESNRVLSMKQELEKFGIILTASDNSVTVSKGLIKTPKKALYGHNDHRIVMALSVLLTQTGGEIEGVEAVNKSYPTFFNELINLGIKVRLFE